MEKLTLAICDDDPAFRALLHAALDRAFSRCGMDIAAVEASSAEELSALLGHMSFDLIFLDIDMPGTDGIRFGEALRARGVLSEIVYVSNMDERVYDIFRVHPWSFIRKSRYADELDAVVEEYVRARRLRGGQILLQTEQGKTLPLEPSKLIYAEASGKSQKLFLSDRGDPALVRASLRELEAQLVPHGFIRIHKGFLVNYRFIHKITSRSVRLDTGAELPIGRDRLVAAREQYLALMKWKGLSRST